MSSLEFTLELEGPFNLNFTLDSGQVFRWERRGEWWYGVVRDGALKVMQEGERLRCSSGSEAIDIAAVTRYFRLDEDLQPILASIAKDEKVTKAVERFYGLRLIRQDVWECLASFLLATNANIPRIKKMVSAICERYGEKSEYEGSAFSRFPTAASLAGARLEDLVRCGLGYRASFLRRVAQSVVDGRIDFSQLPRMGYEEAKRVLLTELLGEKVLLGVGPKVADCVLLFSCGHDDAFPIDVWIARELAKSYGGLLGPSLVKRLSGETAKLGPRDYEKVSSGVRSYFGQYAGYAQQYLFMAARESGA